ncbi:uncharacterized protein TNCV_1226921 [Trichonephila clavipes]|nr:uncharacterized protein TNCV_1226921 [Trichonephila clavipes]
MITNFFIPELNNHDVQELWFQQDGATCQTARATIDLLKDTFGDRLISRFGPVNWPPRSCDLTPLDYFLWGYVKSLVYADKPQTLDHLEDNIRRVIADIRPQMLEKVIENWTSRLDYIRVSRGSHMPEIIFKISYYNLYWVKAHNNNLYNDYADFYAKQAVYDGEVFSVPAPRSFISSSLNKFILESWTSSWNDCNTGLRVKRFFNNPKLNILPISKYLVHFLTNHGPFPAYLHRFNLLPSPNCLFGSPGDADHYVFHCPFTSDHHLVNPSPNALYPWVNSIINNRAIHNKLISCFAISKSICVNLA